MTIGYTAGVYDLFHVGHLNLLRKAKEQCDYLIVAVSTDELVSSYKNKVPIIPYADRKAIVDAIRYVDQTVAQDSVEVEAKIQAAQVHNIDVMFVGDDWKGTEKWKRIEKELSLLGVRVVYLPYTEGISSSIIRKEIIK